MNKDIITSRAEEYKMERDWYIDALDIIESILLEVDTPKSETLLEGKIKRIQDVVTSALDGEPTTADPYNKGDDIEYKYESKTK
tara:strand:+ start:370 stop:621 length:252 start_codon:yes stop_codon:yes gene_type:complete